MSSGPPLRARFSILLLTALLFGCGSDGPAAESEWTIQEGALTLTETLRAGDDEPYFFGEIGDVTAQSDGRIYVADDDAAHVKVLAPNGTLQDTIGRKGEGPGEFQDPEQLVLARGDSLYVLDSRGRRVSVFTPSNDLARDLTVKGFPENLLVPQAQSGFLLRQITLPLSSDSIRGSHVFRRLRPDGSVADTLMMKKRSPRHIVETEDTKWFVEIEFMPSLHAALGPHDRMHLARGDSLAVVSYALDGGHRREVSIPFEPVPVTEEDEERVLEDQTIPRNKIPSTKPAVEYFLADDESRYWFGRPTVNPDSTDWWVADPEQKRVVTTTLPSDVRLHKVTNGRAYGQTTTENGAPALVRYRIHIDN